MDGDMLSYTFEVATSGDFTDTSVVARGNVFEMTEQTEWTVTTVLMDMTRYYWRVWANDGRNDGPSASTHFDVDTSGFIPDPSDDASTDVVDDTTPPWVPPKDESGCGCRTVPAGSAGLPLVALALGLLLLLVRRRR
jgi:MYXO-CTERM domain-containing protein